MKIGTKRGNLKRHYRSHKQDYQVRILGILIFSLLLFISTKSIFFGLFLETNIFLVFTFLFLVSVAGLAFVLFDLYYMIKRGVK